MENRIQYKCKKCGWEASVTSEWPDIKPKKCGNKACKCIFLLNPEELEVKVPEKVEK